MKIKVAHEAPISIMKEVDDLTDYSYALVHLFETHPQYYEYFFYARQQGRDVLLDNSIFELGEAFESEKYAEWIKKLQPTYYVLPDVLEDGYKTIENFIKFASTYDDLPGMRIGTIQGKTYGEIVDCYKFMSDNANMIAISFDMSYYQFTGLGNTKLELQCNGRISLIDDLIHDGIWNHNKPHHLLGCSLAREFSNYIRKGVGNIYSADTSNPVVCGIKGYAYNGEFGLEIKPSQKLVEMIDAEVTDEQMRKIKYNIKNFKHIIAG
jgi:hypothetical protein